MNEKIRQFASKCWETTDRGVPIGNFTEFNKEKFAELIVKECAEVCRKEWVASSSAQRYGDQCANSIEQHFNIKETV